MQGIVLSKVVMIWPSYQCASPVASRRLCGRSGKGTWPYSVGGAATHRGGGKEPRIGI